AMDRARHVQDLYGKALTKHYADLGGGALPSGLITAGKKSGSGSSVSADDRRQATITLTWPTTRHPIPTAPATVSVNASVRMVRDAMWVDVDEESNAAKVWIGTEAEFDNVAQAEVFAKLNPGPNQLLVYLEGNRNGQALLGRQRIDVDTLWRALW